MKKSILMKGAQKMIVAGGVGVLATDTIYGIVGSAMNPGAVEKIYRLRKRNRKKPMIILIASIDDLKLFEIKPDKITAELLKKVWPGKISVVLPNKNKKFGYLRRGTDSLAFRLPNKKNLIRFIEKTGPLVAPSANWEGYPPAKTIKEAKKYFGGKSDFYVDSGKKESQPSTIIGIKGGKVELLREGAVKSALSLFS